MKSNLKIGKEELCELSGHCYDLYNSSSSKTDALKKIASAASAEFGEYFGLNILKNPDEISVNFIELLDQIVFEFEENDSDEDNIKKYIIDDLYLRISIYLKLYKDEELYKKDISKRILSYDDTIIIKHYRMKEYIPNLIDEFFEQPNIQKAILKTLINFDIEELLNFYYQIVKENYCLEIKSLALIGLKGFSSKFTNWHLLKTCDKKLNTLVDYAESFDMDNMEHNNLPYDLYSLFFIINFIELNISSLMNGSTINWICDLLDSSVNIGIENLLHTSIYSSITNIIIYFNLDYMKFFLKNENYMISLTNLIDILPRAFFDRITIKLDLLGVEFIKGVNELLSSGKVKPDRINSNIISYLFWESSKSL